MRSVKVLTVGVLALLVLGLGGCKLIETIPPEEETSETTEEEISGGTETEETTGAQTTESEEITTETTTMESEETITPSEETTMETTAPSEEPTIDTSNWLTYLNEQEGFSFKYPADWLQTEGGGEIQFWDSLEDGVNSIKMALTGPSITKYTNYTSLEEVIEKDETQNFSSEYRNTFSRAEINGLSVLIKQGEAFGPHRIVYYQLSNGSIYALAAYFHTDELEYRKKAEAVQNSFQLTQ